MSLLYACLAVILGGILIWVLLLWGAPKPPGNDHINRGLGMAALGVLALIAVLGWVDPWSLLAIPVGIVVVFVGSAVALSRA